MKIPGGAGRGAGKPAPSQRASGGCFVGCKGGKTMKTETKSMELCLRCLVELEEAGYSAKSVSTGMVICDQCGARCWGGAYRVTKERKACS